MKSLSLTCAGTLFLAHFFISAAAFAQGAQSVQGIDFSSLATFSRVDEKTYPVADAAHLFVAHRFGAIRILGWDQEIIRVNANITVWAENAIQAERFAQKIEIAGNHIGDRVEVRTIYPTIKENAKPGYTVDLEISVPRNSSLSLKNMWGDILVKGTSADLSLDSQYGNIELEDLSGHVRARARGPFPLRAIGLRKGGTFILRSTEAYFEDISGSLKIDNYLGPTEIHTSGKAVEIDVQSESGPIHLYLDEDSKPNIEALVDFGSIESDVLLRSETWGETTQGRLINADSTQRLDLYASFESIYIHKTGANPIVPPSQADPGAGEPMKEVITRSYPGTAGMEIQVDAIIGDIRIEAVEQDRVDLEATQFVRLMNVDKARMALEGLALRVEESGTRLHITTALQDDMAALGCTEYRIDLVLRVPKSTLIQISAENGHTFVSGTNSTVIIEQAKGKVTVDQIQNSVRLTNNSGDIEVSNITGLLTAHATRGTVSARNIKGDLDITCDQGRTIIDGPGANVAVKNSGGDVRIIALEGIKGNYDVSAENGNISMAISNTSDAWLILNVSGGTISSAVPITGTSERDTHAFQGRLNAGTHRVVLETHQGSILID